ncbi:MAG: malto-oligosyltrehalose trehalohydrolase [Candidatus Abyssobacteria bacterium SURF_5]|uniref:Malto-oligosyltrehalose trehalohydrolase n=1 Tax=Abyssobacteria bacterium (strain SURF_5) TaxID=2093360 RepID=A0A3A4NIM3_ABYX5|nr:MAG: malto-oligosyltrehalose trehalohydrolase [Candidatus Abyssubacteria bacterium SURF_5]
MSERDRRKLPIGAEIIPGRGVHFRVWAPRRENVSVVVENAGGKKAKKAYPLVAEKRGYFSGLVPDLNAGALYRFQLNDDLFLPDPASRFQPFGPDGPSQVVDPTEYQWNDQNWKGRDLMGQVFYEMHIGAFTKRGTWRAAVEHLQYLAETGVTILEVMPVHEFPGKFGWGYDGVNLYAPYHHYGTPNDFRSFVDKAHAAGLGVVLDVVYNHFGPVSNYLSEFSFDYFTDRYETEWGYAINFDGNNSLPVREFYIENAGYWIDEFHLDGLRLDATQAIHDQSAKHIIVPIIQRARAKAGRRSIVVVAENEPQNFRLLKEIERGGFGVDAVWNDDFHHSAIVALTRQNEGYYADYLGWPQELISAAKWGYLYQGQFYSWQNKCRGSPVLEVQPSRFINFLQNHDQAANTLRGEPIHLRAHPGKVRALTAFFLLIPGTPLLFQGQEFHSSKPFVYFADHKESLAKIVREGRMQFLKQFNSFRDPEAQAVLPEPSDPATFNMCKLEHDERRTNSAATALYRDLLWFRRMDPVFAAQRTDWMHGAVIGRDIFILRFLGEDKGDRLIIVNLGISRLIVPSPEPLLAPSANTHWELLWSSESVKYGGSGTNSMEKEGRWSIPGNATVVFAPKKVVRLYYA